MGSKYDGSWFEPERRKPSPPELGYTQYLVGKILFKTNDRSLDWEDLHVLAKIATYIARELALDRNVEISLVGRTDYRGRASYNKWLSEQRVVAVADRLGRFVHRRDGFEYVRIGAIGEEQAFQRAGSFKPEAYLMSGDRAVDVWWGLPRMHIMPKLRCYFFDKGFLDRIAGDDHPIVTSPSGPRPIGRRDGLIDL